jgi:hypothetical protein
MPDKAQQKRHTVFKSLHKALPDLGIERTLSYFVGVSAVGAFKPVQFHSRRYRRLHRRLCPRPLGHVSSHIVFQRELAICERTPRKVEAQ